MLSHGLVALIVTFASFIVGVTVQRGNPVFISNQISVFIVFTCIRIAVRNLSTQGSLIQNRHSEWHLPLIQHNLNLPPLLWQSRENHQGDVFYFFILPVKSGWRALIWRDSVRTRYLRNKKINGKSSFPFCEQNDIDLMRSTRKCSLDQHTRTREKYSKNNNNG